MAKKAVEKVPKGEPNEEKESEHVFKKPSDFVLKRKSSLYRGTGVIVSI